MTRAIEAGLVSSLVVAVVAFGGAESFTFAFAQVLLLGTAILLVANSHKVTFAHRPPVAVPLALLGLVLLQLLPLPVGLLRLVRTADYVPQGARWATLSIYPHDTIYGLLLLVTYLAAFYLTVVVAHQHGARRRLIHALLALAGFEALYGMVQFLTGWEGFFANPQTDFPGPEAIGTYINHNHFAGLLEMLLPFALALTLYQFSHLRLAWQHGRASDESRGQKMAFWFLLAVLLLTAVFFSRSRMGMAAAGVATLVVLTLAITSSRQRKAGLAVAAVFVAASLALAIWLGPQPVLHRLEATQISVHPEATLQGRWQIWKDTLSLIGRHPIVGSGLGTFPTDYTSVQATFLTLFVNHAHNDYLEVTSDLGLVGALLLFGTLVWFLGRAVERYLWAKDHFDGVVALGTAGALVALLAHSLTDFNLYLPANAMLVAVILGLFVSLGPVPPEEPSPLPSPPGESETKGANGWIS